MLIKQGFNEEFCVKLTEGEGGDISRKIDILAEEIFIKHLGEYGTIYSEECGTVQGKGAYKITLDPLDGSDNFISQIPYFGTSIALELDGDVLVGIICNLANGEILLKTKEMFKIATLPQCKFKSIDNNDCAAVGIFERAYRSNDFAKKLHDAHIKYRIPGASALSFAYAYRVDFVIFEGDLREFDAKAGLFMCEHLYKYHYNNRLLICKDKKRFYDLKNILLGDAS